MISKRGSIVVEAIGGDFFLVCNSDFKVVLRGIVSV